MKRHLWWRYEYRERRYLEHAGEEELKQRLHDLMDNMCNINAEGNLAMKNPLEEGKWVERFTHLLEEFELRGDSIRPALLQGNHFNARRYVNARRAAELWEQYHFPVGTYLLKFGMRKHLHPLLNVGSLRMCPASFYREPSLNAAIRDTELEFTHEIYGARVHHPPHGDHSLPRGQWLEMPIIGNVKSTLHSHNEYYIACFSSSYEYRL